MIANTLLTLYYCKFLQRMVIPLVFQVLSCAHTTTFSKFQNLSWAQLKCHPKSLKEAYGQTLMHNVFPNKLKSQSNKHYGNI